MKTSPLLFCSIAAIAVSLPVRAETPAVSVRASIEAALSQSAAAWTAGDLAKFMQVYEKSPTIRYIGASGITVGYDAIQSMYAARFDKGASMGKLSLELVDVQQVGPQYTFVIGRYHLQQDSGTIVSGVTSLLFHKVGTQWLIVADHSS
jgi:ketosteroid isomerase-like protein